MDLTTTVAVDEDNSVARVALKGALNTDTAPGFEQQLGKVLADAHQLTVLDMKDLDYISSAGLRVIFKAAKQTNLRVMDNHVNIFTNRTQTVNTDIE